MATYGSPLLIIDCERVRAQYRRLQKALPGVDLHYALKPLAASGGGAHHCRRWAATWIWRPPARCS